LKAKFWRLGRRWNDDVKRHFKEFDGKKCGDILRRWKEDMIRDFIESGGEFVQTWA